MNRPNCQPKGPALVRCILTTDPKDPVDNMGPKCYNYGIGSNSYTGDGRRGCAMVLMLVSAN